MKLKKGLCLSLVFSLIISQVFSVNTLCSDKKFIDVDQSAWYHDTVMYMTQNNYISGYSDGTFKPLQQISRIEYATILFKSVPMTKALSEVTEESKTEFRNKNKDFWGTETILEAYERGIGAFGDDIADWNKPITREEIAYMTYAACLSSAYIDSLTYLGSHTFYYHDIGDTIADYGDCMSSNYCISILSMYSSGIITGSNGNFYPKKTATRAEAAAIACRVIDSSKRGDPDDYQIMHEDAPHYNWFITDYIYEDKKEYLTEPINYDNLDSVSTGSLTSEKYGSMTEQEAKEIQTVVDNFKKNYITDDMSDVKKACIAAEYIMHNCNYGSDDAVRPYTAWGALVGHAAWCTGFSYAYKLLCDSIEVGCVAIPANEYSENPSHMWNAVRIDGYWYIVDIQASDLIRESEYQYPTESGIFFGSNNSYFLVSAERYMNQTGMKWDIESYPICNYNYLSE